MTQGFNKDTTIFLNPDIAFGKETLMLKNPTSTSKNQLSTEFKDETDSSEIKTEEGTLKEHQNEFDFNIENELNAEIKLIEESSIINAKNIATEWKDFHVNSGLTILFIIIGIVSLRPILSIISPALESLFRWRGMLKIEENMPTVRDRNYVASMLIIPFCLIISRYNVYSPAFLYSIPLNMRTLGVIGVFLAYCLLRYITNMHFMNKNSHKGSFDILHKAEYTFFILLNMFMMSSVFILEVIGVSDITIGKAIIYICTITYSIFLLRKSQILATFNDPLTTFLYLCILEIPPTGLLIASALFL